jgi:hypothetical protein
MRQLNRIITKNHPNSTILIFHGVVAALLIMLVIGHSYLSLWVNKEQGTGILLIKRQYFIH